MYQNMMRILRPERRPGRTLLLQEHTHCEESVGTPSTLSWYSALDPNELPAKILKFIVLYRIVDKITTFLNSVYKIV